MRKMYPYEVVNILRKGEVNVHVAVLSKEIEDLQKTFASTDYKTIKNSQYEKMGLELPYSWEEIYAEAEEIRVKIREKETQNENLLKITTAAAEVETTVEVEESTEADAE